MIAAYQRKGRSLLLEIDEDNWDSPVIRQINGKSITGRRLESPFAAQGPETALRVAGCSLKKNSVPLLFIADSERRHYVVTNPCREATPIVLKTPHGTIRCDSLPRGRIICKLDQRPSVHVETFEKPGRISAERMGKPKITTLIRS